MGHLLAALAAFRLFLSYGSAVYAGQDDCESHMSHFGLIDL